MSQFVVFVAAMLLTFSAQAPGLSLEQASVRTQEVVCLAVAVHTEARGEPIAGQKAVLEVIQNRMKLRNLSACEVVKQPGQFPWYKRGTVLKMNDYMLTRWQELTTMPSLLASNVEYFHATSVKPVWTKGMKRAAAIGAHVFYADKETK